MNSKLGWLLFGKVKALEYTPQVSSLHITTESESLNEILKAFWEIEQIPEDRKLTVKEQQAETEFRNNIKKSEEGRYQVTLPFNPIKLSEKLGESRVVALHSLYRMEKRFALNQLLKQRYHEYIQNLLQSNHLELVPSDRLGIPNENKFSVIRVIDGTASATFLATRVLHQTAIDGENEFPEAAQVVEKDFYMDDVSSGSYDVSSAIKLQNDLISLLKRGKFNLRKWFSNSRELLENVPLENQHNPNEIFIPFVNLEEREVINDGKLAKSKTAPGRVHRILCDSYSENLDFSTTRWDGGQVNLAHGPTVVTGLQTQFKGSSIKPGGQVNVGQGPTVVTGLQTQFQGSSIKPGGQVNVGQGPTVVTGLQTQFQGSSTKPGGQVNLAHGPTVVTGLQTQFKGSSIKPGGQVNVGQGPTVVTGLQTQFQGSSTKPGGQVNLAHGPTVVTGLQTQFKGSSIKPGGQVNVGQGLTVVTGLQTQFQGSSIKPGGQVNVGQGPIVVTGLQTQFQGSSTKPGGQVNLAHGLQTQFKGSSIKPGGQVNVGQGPTVVTGLQTQVHGSSTKPGG
ncbi:hypothetical protein Bhyg_08293, partial [Pseudolycoriella hygida]